MKKFIKRIILFLIIASIIGIAYYRRYDFANLLESLNIQVKSNFEETSQKMYTNEEIEQILKSSNVIIDEGNFAKLDNYYYEQLDTYAKIIYKTLLDNIDKLKVNSSEIKISNALSNIMQEQDGKEKINIAFQNAWNAIRLDHPEIYYINVDNIYLTTKTTTFGKKVTYEFYLNNKNSANILKEEILTQNSTNYGNEISQKKQEIINNISNYSNFEKVLYVHNWIIDNVEYDINMKNNNNDNIYGSMIENKAICEGYAKTFKYLLDEIGIPCVIICGDVTDENGNIQKHAWNAVYMKGNWYSVDVTWDDPIIIGNGKITNSIKYKYFLKGSIEMEKSHKQNGRLSDDNKEIEFKYPELSRQDYKK